jgi:hypothetical protein
MKAFKVKNWEDVFETAESRRLKGLSWVAMPNKWDGLGFCRLRKHKNFVSVFSGWSLIVQIASKMPQRGLLVNADGPLSAQDMADLTGCPVDIFEKALDVLCDPNQKICWIETADVGGNTPAAVELPELDGFVPARASESAGTPADDAGKASDAAKNLSIHNKTGHDKTEQHMPEPEKELDESKAEQVYKAYPRKVGKIEAVKAIKKAFREEPFEKLLEAVTEYARATEGADMQYIPHPATWFNAGRWNDDRSQWAREGRSGQSSKLIQHYDAGPKHLEEIKKAQKRIDERGVF